MSDPLSRLKIEHWWHAFTVVGAGGIIAALAFDSKVVGQKEALLFAIGLFLFGVGQWINHPRSQRVVPGFIITNYDRHATALGIVFETIGVVAVIISSYRIFR